MQAIRIFEHGSSDVLKLVELAKPTPGPKDVLVKTKATSLNHMDIWVREGIPGIAPLPLTLGCDLAGVVESCGSEVTNFKSGDRVFLVPLFSCENCAACKRGDINLCKEFKIPGEHTNGTHAEFFCAPEHKWIKLSDKISFAVGAAFPLAFMTAWHMLVANGKIQKGDDILVMAASSGVGSAAVQIAKHFGARVIATAGGAEKSDTAKSLGADHVIDHYNESISKCVKEITNKKGVEVIFEHVGEKVWDECLRSLAWGGRLVTCGATSGPNIKMDLRHIFIKQQQIIGSTMGTKAELETIHELVASGDLKVSIAKTFKPTEIKSAHEYLETTKGFGKVVLEWG